MPDEAKPCVAAALDALGGSEIAQAKADQRALAAPQADFFQPAASGSSDPDESARLDGALPLGIPKAASRGPGRPAGSRNRRTVDVANYLVQRYGDPLEGAVSIGMRPLRDLVQDLKKIAADENLKLGGSVLEIARFQAACRDAALPYLHAKRAPEDDKGTPIVPIISIGGGSNVTVQPGHSGGRARSIEDAVLIDNPPQQNQQVSSDPAKGSDAKGSDDAG